MRLLPSSLLALLAVVDCAFGKYNERYDESLKLTSLRDGRVLASFDFKTVLRGAVPRDPVTLGTQDDPQHYTLFPLALGQILREHAIAEIHLTLNAGRWRYDDWGAPSPEIGTLGTGGELRAWMADGGPVSVDERWSGLRNALSGLFCASLSGMDNRRTTSPVHAFLPGSLPAFPHSNSTYHLRHASLPAEGVCTENLTPFVKLLPCTTRSGLGELLAPHKLFDADWHGMGVHVSWEPEEGVVLRLGVRAVFNPVRTNGDGKRDWSMDSLFGRTLHRACPAASSSSINVLLASHSSISPPFDSISEDGFAAYNVHKAPKPVDVSLRWHGESSFAYPVDMQPSLSPLSVDRVITTPDQTRGTLHVSIKNNADNAVDVIYAETLPWLVTLYLHTLKVTIDGQPRDDAFSLLRYIPTHDTSPTLLEAKLRIPAGRKMKLTMDLDKRFLRYTEHPPDAQRGWDLPGAVFAPLPSNASSSAPDSVGSAGIRQAIGVPERGERTYIHTRTLLLDLATPDFSMPYNVIIMTCTLVALMFGSVFNMLIREFVVVDMTEGAGEIAGDPPGGDDGAEGKKGDSKTSQ